MADCVDDLHATSLQLPDRERLALQALYFLGQSVDEARAALGLSRSGFYAVLKRAHARLGRRLRIHREDVP